MQYRREIDGLRAVAVVPVILFHAGFEVFSGGYVGVDVFFVISGYLITTILIDERERGEYSLLKFYERRARRILPALFLVMAVCIPFAWLWIPPYQFENFARSVAFAAMFISNVHFWEHTGYFALHAEVQPLLHTWSLAIEEQYYLLFPLLLVLLGRFRRLLLIVVFGVLAALSLGLAEWGWRNYPDANFFFTFSRFWELLAGSICAVWLYKRPLAPNDWLAALGLAMIIYSILFYGDAIPFPSVYTLIPVAGTALIILFASTGTKTAQVLSFKVFVGIGLISYSAYLWHQPLFAFARIYSLWEPSQLLMTGLAVLTLILAYLSWRFVEQPFRRRPVPVLPVRRKLFAASGIGTATFVVLGLYGLFQEGIPSRVKGGETEYLASISESFKIRQEYADCRRGKRFMPDRKLRICVAFEPEKVDQVFAVIGDSHAAAILPAFADISDSMSARILSGAVAGCPPLLGVYISDGVKKARQCNFAAKSHAKYLKDNDVSAVFLVARWALYTRGSYEGVYHNFVLRRDLNSAAPSTETWHEVFETGLRETIDFYKKAGIRVFVIEQVPQQKLNPLNVIERAKLLRIDDVTAKAQFEDSFVEISVSDALQAYAEEQFDTYKSQGVEVLSLDDLFVAGTKYKWIKDSEVLFLDTDHLTVHGARFVAPHLTRMVKQALERS